MNKLNVNRLMETLSAILSDRYNAKIVLTAQPKTVDRAAG